MPTGTTGPTGAMKSFVVGYRTTAAGATMAVEAEDRERAVAAALEQIAVDGGSVEILQTVELPSGAGPTGASGSSGASGPTGS